MFAAGVKEREEEKSVVNYCRFEPATINFSAIKINLPPRERALAVSEQKENEKYTFQRFFSALIWLHFKKNINSSGVQFVWDSKRASSACVWMWMSETTFFTRCLSKCSMLDTIQFIYFSERKTEYYSTNKKKSRRKIQNVYLLDVCPTNHGERQNTTQKTIFLF